MSSNGLSSDNDDSQSMDIIANIQSSLSGYNATNENTSDLVELQNCSKITFGDDETNKDYHRIVNKTNDLNDLQNGANESIDDDDNNDNESTPIKEQELNQVEPTTSNYIKQLILSFFGLELISQCISITSENVDDVIKFVLLVCESLGLTVREEAVQETETTLCSSIFFRCCYSHEVPYCCLKVSHMFRKSTNFSFYEINLKLKGEHSNNFKDQYKYKHPVAYSRIHQKIHNLTQLKLKSVQKDLKKYKVQRSKRNKAKRIWAQRKSDLELVRKLDEVIPRVVKYIEDGVAQSDDKTKEACEKYVKIANKSKNGNQ